jgi:hypothetical protein
MVLETLDKLWVGKNLALEFLIVLVFRADKDDKADLALLADIGEEVAVRPDPEVGQSASRGRAASERLEVADKAKAGSSGVTRSARWRARRRGKEEARKVGQ